MFSFHSPFRSVFVSALFGGCALLAVSSWAKTPEPPGLFSQLRGNPQAVLPAQALAGRSQAVKINYGRLRSGQFFVSLPGGLSFEAVRELQQELGKERFAWVGHAEGDPNNSVVIGVSGNAVAGTFSYQGRLFKLEPRANGNHVLSEVGITDPAAELDPIAVADATSNSTDATSTTQLAADSGLVLDVLVAYTPTIQNLYGAQGADALIIQAVAETNQAYANSGIAARLNLVHTVLTAYTESGDMGNDLARLRNTSDGYMDELHGLRDSHGADLVSLIENEPQYCGIAYRMASLSASFASSAFSVVNHSCATGYYSFGHELGHNQGAHHDHNNASGAIYSYAYGHQEPFNAFRTVMAYNCSGGCSRKQYFSNPDVFLNGMPTGEIGYADNARAIDNTAATVAGFRQQVSQTAPLAPSGLSAMASSHSTMSLIWSDNSSDESGFRLERANNGSDFVTVASLSANSTAWSDEGLLPDTLYSYRVQSWNSAGDSAYSQAVIAATNPLPPVVDQVATGDVSVAGTVTGGYQNTWSSDGIQQTIQERESGGNPRNRYGYLEHKWTFQVQPGNSVMLLAEAKTTASADSFTFAYSTDNSSFINMFVVGADTAGTQQFMLPASLSGTLYVRVRDNTRNAGERTAHSVQIDQLLVRSENNASVSPPVAPELMSALADGSGQVSIAWLDQSDNESGFKVERQTEGASQWSQVYVTAAEKTSYLDTGLQPATRYYYRVQAFNGGGESPYSNIDSALTAAGSSYAIIDLSARGYKVKGQQAAELTWYGAAVSSVDIYRNGSLLVGGVANTGNYTDPINSKGGGSYLYEVCEAGTTICSNSSSVVF